MPECEISTILYFEGVELNFGMYFPYPCLEVHEHTVAEKFVRASGNLLIDNLLATPKMRLSLSMNSTRTFTLIEKI